MRLPEKDPYAHAGFQPMLDERFDGVFANWLTNFDRIRAGDLTATERECYPRGLADWLHDEGAPPNPAYYRDYADEDATWFQMYETVSEGTPTTPPFETREELVAHLCAYGQSLMSPKYRDAPWDRANAEQFVDAGWAPSMIVSAGRIYTARDGLPT